MVNNGGIHLLAQHMMITKDLSDITTFEKKKKKKTYTHILAVSF